MHRSLRSLSSPPPPLPPLLFTSLHTTKTTKTTTTKYVTSQRWNTTGPGKAFVNAFVNSVKRQVKENQELNENIKFISAEASKFTESDSLKRAKEIMEKANQEGSAASSKAFQQTAKVAKKVVDTVTDTPLARAASTTFKVTANVIEQAARTTAQPIVQSKTYQHMSTHLANAIREASSKYGGVSPKALRDLIKQRRLLEHALASNASSVSTDLVLHASSSSSSGAPKNTPAPSALASFFKTQWHAVAAAVEKSDRLWISWPRWLVYKVRGVVAPLLEGTEMSRAMTKLKQVNPGFHLDAFLHDAREFMLPEILEAWLLGDKAALSLWCSEASVNVLTAPNAALAQQHLVSACKLLDVAAVDAQAKLTDTQAPVLVVTFQTQEVLVFKDKGSGETRLGKEDHILKCNYVLVFAFDDSVPVHPITRNWRVVDQAKHTLGATV